MHEDTSFVSLLIVVTVAALVPMITTQLRSVRIPIVVGEIIAGMIIGRSGFNWVHEDMWLSMLSTLGFAYLMFLSGLEVDFDSLIGQVISFKDKSQRRITSPIVLASLTFILTLVVAYLVALGLKGAGWIEDPSLMALILSTTSLGLVVPVLKERGELRQEFGQSLLLASLLADFITMLLISVYVILHTKGLTLEIMLVLVLLGAFISLYRILRALMAHPPFGALFDRVAESAGHMPVRMAFAIGLAFIALAEGLGVEAILGAFLGGAMIALLSPHDDTPFREKLDTFGYAFFIPLFFVMVGVRFDLKVLLGSPSTLLLAPILLIAAFLIKLLPALVLRLRYSWRQTITAGLLLSSRLSLIIAAAAIGLELGAIDEAVQSAIILLAIVTCTVAPLLYNRLAPALAEEAEAHVVVAGSTLPASLLAERFAERGEPVVYAALALAASDDPAQVPVPVPPLPHSPVRSEVIDEISVPGLRALELSRAKALVIMHPDDAASLRLCQIASTSFRVPNIVAHVRERQNTEAFSAAGAQPVTFNEARETVLEHMVTTPNVFRLLAHQATDQEVIEIPVQNPDLDQKLLHQLHMPGESVIMVIQRHGRFLVPRGDTRLNLGDTVTVLASPNEIDSVYAIFSYGV
ncbi:MAG: cation:proton antiporter [Chloroflexota bacterium]